jgi:Ca-activated chloride channel homolog
MLRLLLHIIIILSLPLVSSNCGSAFAQSESQKPSGANPEEAPPLRINTAVVTLSVGVSDRKGQPLANLAKESFEIFEDGKLQKIEFFGEEDQPISFGLLIDRSLSMNDSAKNDSAKIEKAKAVAISFLRAGNPQNEAYCLAFNESPSIVADFTSDYAKIESSLSEIQTEGGTALYDAIIKGLEKLEQAKHRRRALVIITDGRDQDSKHSLADLVKRAQQSDAQIYTVGFYSPIESKAYRAQGSKVKLSNGKETDNPRLVFKTLADATGAETFFPKSAEEFTQAIARIAASLRRQYTLAYYPTNPSAYDAYRRIMIKVKGDHGEVKTRRGYRLSGPLDVAAETAEVRPESEKKSAAGASPQKVAKEAKGAEGATVAKGPPKEIRPVEAPAPQFLREKFEDISGSLVKWPQSGNCAVKNGKLYVAEDCVVPVGEFIYGDFEAAVTATFLARPQRPAGVKASGSANAPMIGLSFRINGNGYYKLLIAPPKEGGIGGGGFYKLLKIAGGEQTELTPWRKDTSILMRNFIELRCAGSKIEIFANNLRLGSLNDISHKRGSISLTFSGETATFDDLAIKKLN